MTRHAGPALQTLTIAGLLLGIATPNLFATATYDLVSENIVSSPNTYYWSNWSQSWVSATSTGGIATSDTSISVNASTTSNGRGNNFTSAQTEVDLVFDVLLGNTLAGLGSATPDYMSSWSVSGPAGYLWSYNQNSNIAAYNQPAPSGPAGRYTVSVMARIQRTVGVDSAGSTSLSLNITGPSTTAPLALTAATGTGIDWGSVTTTSGNSTVFTPASSQQSGYIDILGNDTSHSIGLLDLAGTSSNVTALLNSLSGNPNFTLLQPGDPRFDQLAAQYPGWGWDAAIAFTALPPGAAPGNMKFNWDFTGTGVTLGNLAMLPVPEPASLSLVALAALPLLRRRR